jgi:formylglycine-generating enzyme required for sulfatase activity
MPLSLLDAALGTLAALAVPMLAVGLHGPLSDRPPVLPAETIAIAERTIDFPAPGEFLLDGQPVAAPVSREAVAAFRIMKRQVSRDEYKRCVAAGVCIAADASDTPHDVPVTGVNWIDAEAYALWYSKATHRSWRLPTALEAAAAAAERFGDSSFSAAADDQANPAVRWIRRYREEASAKRPRDLEPRPGGHYGSNTLGVEDFGGNVWEWTSTCYSRVTLSSSGGDVKSVVENCGVHVLEGLHRAYMSSFVRDGRSGGCAVGRPPETLGFRLVLDEAHCGLSCRVSMLRSNGSN